MFDLDFVKKEFGKYNIQYWDCRYSETESTGISFWNKKIKHIGQGISKCVGVRVLSRDGWGFSGGTKFEKKDIRKLISDSVRMARLLDKKEKIDLGNLKTIKDSKVIKGKQEIGKVSLEDKKDFLQEQNYSLEKPITSVFIGYSDSVEKKIFLSPFREIHQRKDSLFLAGKVSAVDSGKSEEKHFRATGAGGFETVKNVQKELDEAIAKTKKFIQAKPLKGGKSDLVLSGELTGLFVHEALGHASESDLLLVGQSCLKGRIGESLSSDFVNVLEDPTQDGFNELGSYYYDDEGIPARKNFILKKGKLNSYLHTLETASKMGASPTGNGRVESSLNLPLVRMSNTYLGKGDCKFDDLIKEIKEGYFLSGFNGGETNPTDGSFQFGVGESYKIKKGKIVSPVRGGGIGGFTLDFLKKIKLIENKYSEGSPGLCGKWGQSVPTGGKNPAVLVKEALLV